VGRPRTEELLHKETIPTSGERLSYIEGTEIVMTVGDSYRHTSPSRQLKYITGKKMYMAVHHIVGPSFSENPKEVTCILDGG
jgi:hypothetical protein